MEKISIFNDVLGPVMRGPSSSHTAGSYRIGRMARSLVPGGLEAARLTFDPDGSYAQVYREQGVDLAFAAGFLGWSITDDRFASALELAAQQGIRISFAVNPLERADHPNSVHLSLTSMDGETISLEAKSTGGGGILVTRFQDWPVRLDGKRFIYLAECDREAAADLLGLIQGAGIAGPSPQSPGDDDFQLLVFESEQAWKDSLWDSACRLVGAGKCRRCEPVFLVTPGEAMFRSGEEMIALSEETGVSLGEMALKYEAALLALSEEQVLQEMMSRLDIMHQSIDRGLQDSQVRMQLLPPSARSIWEAEQREKVAIGGLHTRAAVRAMAAMHTSNSQGVVVAAPTGGAAGVIPGVIATLVQEKHLPPEGAARALLAAGAVGIIVAARATFAAETAGCQVEIGAAGAMAAAAVVEWAGGTARQAADAAAISFQNSMGSVCDLVQGMCEIPCHTRNAVAASSAFVCADLILGGYANPVPLDETVDAVLSSGRMLPSELRVTAKGGLALAPSARSLPRRKWK